MQITSAKTSVEEETDLTLHSASDRYRCHMDMGTELCLKREPEQREVSMDLNIWPEPKPLVKPMEPSRELAVLNMLIYQRQQSN